MKQKTEFKQTENEKFSEVSSKMKQTEIGKIPEDWEVKKISQIGEVITGKTPKTVDKDNFGNDYMFITPRDMKVQKHIFETERYLSEKGKNSVKNCLIPKKSICVSCIGSDMGKVIMTTKESITNQQINSIIPEISADFIYYAILNISSDIKNLGKQSTAVPILNKSQFSKIEIATPSKINETEKKIKKEFEKNYNKKMNKFNNKIDSSKEQIEERFYDNFNIRQNGKDIFNEDINDQIITQAAESLVGKAKEKIALEYKEKLEEMLEKKNECDGMVENIRENLLDEYKDKAMEEINSKYFDQLIERGLIEVGKDGVYEVNKKGVTELIAKKAFDETMKILGGNRRSGRGTHKSKTMGFGEPILDKTKKTNKVSRSLAILPTMRRSIIRRAVKPNSPIIIEDDLVEYDNLKNISYATVIAIDKSSSMEGENMESAKNCALSLAYYMKKKHRKDKIDYLTFEDYVEEIKFEDILDIYPNNYTNTGAAIKLGREILDKYGRKEKLLYLITDGYPQGRYDESTEERQEFALKQARKLKDDNIELVEILLNNGSSRMVGWGKKIATEANGTLFHVKDPSNLGAFVIDNFSRRKRGG